MNALENLLPKAQASAVFGVACPTEVKDDLADLRRRVMLPRGES